MSYNYEREKYYRDRNKVLVLRYLKENPCVDCGEKDTRVLDFDHVRGKKIKNVSDMVKSGNCSWNRIKNEIDKCQVRCANCHRKKTIGEPKWFTDLDSFEYDLKRWREQNISEIRRATCGTRRMYSNGCRCDKCTEAQRLYMRGYKKKVSE